MTALTVIMPTYNGAKFLRPQIDSILSQTASDLLLLVQDDGSTDDTVAIVDDYARRDRRVRRLPSTSNLGQRRRLYDLANAVETEFLGIADQDDLWHPDRNALLLDAIGDSAVAFGRSQLIDGEGREIGKTILQSLQIDPRSGPLTSMFQPLVSAHAAVVRSSWLSRGVFSSIAPFDHIMGLEAQLSTGLIYCDEATVYHRLHGGNQMNQLRKKKSNLFSPYRLRAGTSFIRAARVEFFLMASQVSRSMALDPRTRKAFWSAADECRYAWYQPLNWRPFKDRRLEGELHRLLDGYAGSPDDLAFFADRVRSMTRTHFSPRNIHESIRIYREHGLN